MGFKSILTAALFLLLFSPFTRSEAAPTNKGAETNTQGTIKISGSKKKNKSSSSLTYRRGFGNLNFKINLGLSLNQSDPYSSSNAFQLNSRLAYKIGGTIFHLNYGSEYSRMTGLYLDPFASVLNYSGQTTSGYSNSIFGGLQRNLNKTTKLDLMINSSGADLGIKIGL